MSFLHVALLSLGPASYRETRAVSLNSIDDVQGKQRARTDGLSEDVKIHRNVWVSIILFAGSCDLYVNVLVYMIHYFQRTRHPFS